MKNVRPTSFPFLSLLFAFALAGCGSDPGSSAASTPGDLAAPACAVSIAGGGTQISETAPCVNCTVSNEEHAVDGAAGTYASVVFKPPNDRLEGKILVAGAVLRATAQSGVVFPAGNTAGAVLLLANKALTGIVGISADLTVRTYLATVLQETATFSGYGFNETPRLYGLTATKQFNAVEIELYDGCCGRGTETRIYEFCGQG